MENKFDLLLPSNVVSEKSGHVNTIGCYTTILPKPLVFESHDWMVGLRSISYTYSWFNVKEGDYCYLQSAALGRSAEDRLPFAVPKHGEEIGERITLLPGRYESAEDIVKSIETKLSRLSDSRIAELPSLRVHKASSRLVVKTGRMKDDTPLSIWFSKDLAGMLGYEEPIVIIHKESLPSAIQQREKREASVQVRQRNRPFCDQINENPEEQTKLSKFPGLCNIRSEEKIPTEKEKEITPEDKNKQKPIATDQQPILQSGEKQKVSSQQYSTTAPSSEDNTSAGKQEKNTQETPPTDENRQDKETEKPINPTQNSSSFTLSLSKPAFAATESKDVTSKKLKPNPEQASKGENVATSSSGQTSENQSIDFSELPTHKPLLKNLGLRTPVLKGERRIDMNRGIYNMMVYSNVGDYMTVGDTRCQLLQSVEIPSKAKIGDQLVKRYDNPDYIPLHSLFIPSVEIELKDDTGRPLEFEFGRVTVRLHFKKKEAPHTEYYGELLS